MKVRDIMTTRLITADAEATIGAAATQMGENRVGSVMVVDGDLLLGILTERDIVRALSNTFDAPTRPIDEWMTKNPVTVLPDGDVREALRAMVEGGFRHLPVCVEGRSVGMVSIRDVAAVLSD